MTDREQQIRQAIVAHMTKHNRMPSYFERLGFSWHEASPVWDAMLADGTLRREVRVSPKGRNITHVVLGSRP